MYAYRAGLVAALTKLGMVQGPTHVDRVQTYLRKLIPKSRIGKGALAGGVIGTGMAIKNLSEEPK